MLEIYSLVAIWVYLLYILILEYQGCIYIYLYISTDKVVIAMIEKVFVVYVLIQLVLCKMTTLIMVFLNRWSFMMRNQYHKIYKCCEIEVFNLLHGGSKYSVQI